MDADNTALFLPKTSRFHRSAVDPILRFLFFVRPLGSCVSDLLGDQGSRNCGKENVGIVECRSKQRRTLSPIKKKGRDQETSEQVDVPMEEMDCESSPTSSTMSEVRDNVRTFPSAFLSFASANI